MNAVRLSKTDTCLTYALKRAGHYLSLPNLQNAEQVSTYFSLTEVNSCDQLKTGDIIMWDDLKRETFAPIEILENGMVISQPVHLQIHFAVVEESDYLISDATISSRDYPFCHTIRVREINSVPNFFPCKKLIRQ